MTPHAALSQSQEDYLKAIFRIVEEKQAARARDIAKRLGVHASSVTQALRALSEKGLVNYAPYDIVTLTPAGRKAAGSVVERHDTLQDFLVKVLGIDEETAAASACEMEHAVSGLIMDRLLSFIEYVDSCPIGRVKWNARAGYKCTARGDIQCSHCGGDVPELIERFERGNMEGTHDTPIE
jgi:DtxR family Mn-dependent transcriptional regulator